LQHNRRGTPFSDPKKARGMNATLSLPQIMLLVFYAAAMACGQLLFKLAALRGAAAGGLGERLFSLAANRYFAAAVVLYAVLTLLWVWILTFTPLSRAYVFVALAFAFTPLAGGAVFGEPITLRLVIGIGFICCGLLFVAS
jgi:drug/metabolite transporter (DMT)-like permease